MHISIIDDEKLLSEKIAKKLRNNGFAASSFLGYKDFMKHGDSKSQLYIIDFSLRDGSGLDIVQWLRKEQKCTAPVIMISGHTDVENRITGLNIGADDYIVKPFLPDELLARVHALLRRSERFGDRKILRYKSICLNTGNREITVGERRVHLTRTEQIILETFIENAGIVMDREKLVRYVWWGQRYGSILDNTISVHISNLKKKLGDDFSVHTEYGSGYVLRD